jgi:pyruvate dehydrogenase E1 component alpha subunit
MAVANELEKRSAGRKGSAESSSTSPDKNGTDTNGNGHPQPEDAQTQIDRLRMMMLIRRFEEQTFREYTKPGQKIGGFCHLYSGQEAIAVGTAALFEKKRDYLINGYRCHGHSLALGMSPHSAMAELFGKVTGSSKGKGGSMHLFDSSVGNMGGHGIVGGQLPLGVGLAFAQHYKKTGGVTFTFMGDGAINQGTHNESLNLASLYKLPCIFVVENNGVAMGTQVERSSAEKDLAERGSGYAMPHYHVNGNDVDVVIAEFGKAVERGRSGGGPSYIVADTYRFRGHSTSDPQKYRKLKDGSWAPEVEEARKRDPITCYQARLVEKGIVTLEQAEAMEQEVADEVSAAIQQADADVFPDLNDRFNDVLAEKYPLEK